MEIHESDLQKHNRLPAYGFAKEEAHLERPLACMIADMFSPARISRR
jgi:hypothetical protein